MTAATPINSPRSKGKRAACRRKGPVARCHRGTCGSAIGTFVAEPPFVSICFSPGFALDASPRGQLLAYANVARARIRRAADRGRTAQREARGAGARAPHGPDGATVLVPQCRARAARRVAGRDRPAPADGRPHRLAHRGRPGPPRPGADLAGRPRPPRAARPAHAGGHQAGGEDRAGRRLRPLRPGPGDVTPGAGRAPGLAANGDREPRPVRGGAHRRPCGEGHMIAALLALVAAARVVTLDDALQTARERQPQLRQARANTQAAGARARESLAPLLPQLNATAGYQRTTAHGIERPGFVTVTDQPGTFNSFSNSINLSQLIFDFGAGPNRWNAAKAQADAQAATERATALQVDFTVRSAYFDARANRALLQVARDNLANVQKHLLQT